MHRSAHRLLAPIVTAALAFGLLAPAYAGAQGRAITERDLFAFHWVADPQISPDGSRIAYTLVSVNERENRYETSIWVVASDGHDAPRRLTAGTHDGGPRWAPDAHALAFTRSVDDTSPPQLYLLSMVGGEPRQLTDLAKGAGPAVWAPDGHALAVTSTTLSSDTSAAMKDSIAHKLRSDVRIITRAEFRNNDRGWLDPTRHSHIWRVDLTGDHGEGPLPAHQLTSGNYDEGEPTWSKDGSQILFVSDRVNEPYYDNPDANVYAVPAEGGAIKTLIDIDGPIRSIAPSPDDQAVAFIGYVNPPHPQSYRQSAVFVSRNGTAEQITRGGSDIGSALTGDQHPPRGGGSTPLVWSADNHTVMTAITEQGRSNLVRIDLATHWLEPVTAGPHDIIAYTATRDGKTLALTMGDATHIGDLYALDARSGAMTQLTHVNDALWAQLHLSSIEAITYRSFDGKPIGAWIVKPPDFSPGTKYPLILNIHGGPHAAYGETFFHEADVMAARGYVVLLPNPRGSTSYGEDFGNVIQYRYPGDDYRDLMIGVDTLIARGYIDPKRLGVTGGSGGGLLTNWVVGHTHRFAAAVSQRSIADWAAWWYTADFTLFRPTWFRQPPFRDPQDFAQRSPITYVDQVTTPLMLIEGEADSRTPSGSGGMTMFRALKALHRTTVMVSFPGETHELSRSGKPRHRVERIQHMINWFDKYLEDKPFSMYDGDTGKTAN